jgi:hypothetical protein
MDFPNSILYGEVGYYKSPSSPERKHAIKLIYPKLNIFGTDLSPP